MTLFNDLIKAFLLYLPAMVSNGTPVVMGRLVKRRHPIDFNKVFIDGRPVLGQGKTWEGFIAGVMIGGLFGILVHFILVDYPLVLLSLYIPLGALVGDIVGSFVKRRIGIKRGDPLPLLDQLDFYLGSTLVIIAYGTYPSLLSVLIMGLVIYLLHRTTNVLAYKLGLKEVPW